MTATLRSCGVSLAVGMIALLAAAPGAAGVFLINEHDAGSIWQWNSQTLSLTLYHSVTSNDADINLPEGPTYGWLAEHYGDSFARFVPGSGSGYDTQYPLGSGGRTHYAYPKHVTVFNGEIVVMDRNTGTFWRYDGAGNQIASVSTGVSIGQGMATNGTDLFVSVWNGSLSSFQRYSSGYALLGTFANPSGLTSGNNIFDLAYDQFTGHFFGLVTTGEGGTGTQTQTVVEFTMGGSLAATYTLAVQADGIGQFVLQQAAGEPVPALGLTGAVSFALVLLALGCALLLRHRAC